MKGIFPVFLVASLISLLLTGCQSNSAAPSVGDTGFLAFEGAQRTWPTDSGGVLVQRDHALPIYRGLPSESYQVLGRIIGTQTHVIGRAFAQGLWSDRDRLANVVEQARRQGANAVLLTNHPEIMEALRVTAGEAGIPERPLYEFDGAVVAIKLGR